MSFNSTFSALSSRGFGVNLPAGWIQQTILESNDIANTDEFGYSVALNNDATYLVVGARSESTSPLTDQGAAYVFTRSGTTWTQQAKLLANDAASSDLFGYSVSINNIGDTILVSTIQKADQGAAYVFTRSGTTWTQQAKLLSSDIASGDGFGSCVSLDGTGDYAIIGASGDDISPNTNCGSAYIFIRSGTTWTQQAKLIAPTRTNSALFGGSVQISNDSNYVVIGAQQNGSTQFGKAYVFARSGSTWSLQLETSGSGALSVGRDRGRTVTINNDGSKIMFASGSIALNVWIYSRIGSTWSETQLIQNILSPTTPALTNIVNSQGISTNNDTSETMLGLYIPSVSINNKVYNIISNPNYYVTQVITGSDLTPSDNYGFCVSIAQSINYAAVGAPLHTYPSSKGAVYIIYKPA